VAPIKDVEQALWLRSREGRLSPRYFSLPEGTGKLALPVVDVRLLATLDKRLVFDDQVEHVARLPESLTGPFSEWLGRRFARYAFDDDLEEELLGPIRSRLSRRYESQTVDGNSGPQHRGGPSESGGPQHRAVSVGA
jgi:hypothetical protein